jgi:hypothetical protein
MDGILAYMYQMIKKARGKTIITKETLINQGKVVELFEGVEDWFELINEVGRENGFEILHYIVSSGIKTIIEGTSIAKHFDKIFACEFCYDEDGVPFWPALDVNYTNKTQFLFRIIKGALDVTDDIKLNEFQPEDERAVLIKNMIYIGDGLTDVPCMKVTKMYGGHAIAVYNDDSSLTKMLSQDRIDFLAPADYRKGSDIFNIVSNLIKQLAD